MGPNYSLNDLWKLFEIGRSPGMRGHLDCLPGMQELFATGEDPDAVLSRLRRIIDAMSDLERVHPEVLDSSDRVRIAEIAATQPHEVEKLITACEAMRSCMDRIAHLTLWQRMKLLFGIGNR